MRYDSDLSTSESRNKLWDRLQRENRRCTALEQINLLVWWFMTAVYAFGLLLSLTYLLAWEAEDPYFVPFLAPLVSLMTELCQGDSDGIYIMFPILICLLPAVAGHLLWGILYLLWPRKRKEPFPQNDQAGTQLSKMETLCRDLISRYDKMYDEVDGFLSMLSKMGRPLGVHTVSMLLGLAATVAVAVMTFRINEGGHVAGIIMMLVLTLPLFLACSLVGQAVFGFAIPRRIPKSLRSWRQDIQQAQAVFNAKRQEENDAKNFSRGVDALLQGDYNLASILFDRLHSGFTNEAYDAAKLLLAVRTGRLSDDLLDHSQEDALSQLKKYAARGSNPALAECCAETAKLLQSDVRQRKQQRAEKASELAKKGMELYQDDFEKSAIQELEKAIAYGSVDAVPPYVEAKIRNESYRSRNNKQMLEQLKNAKKAGFSDLYLEKWGFSASFMEKWAGELEIRVQEALEQQERDKRTVVMGSEDYARIAAKADAHLHRVYGSATPDRTDYDDLDAIEKAMREDYGPDWSKDV